MIRWMLFMPLLLVFASPAEALILKNGDIILQPTYCYLCSLIEAEEKTPYSHMGVIVGDRKTGWKVLESWGTVHMTSLEEFLSRRKKNTTSAVIRLDRKFHAKRMKTSDLLVRFIGDFDGRGYDSQFLWDNYDTKGEKLYCSEFVAKFMEPFMSEPLPIKPMHYEINRESWIKYFQGTPPDGKPGISPGDFERSPLFKHVGYL